MGREQRTEWGYGGMWGYVGGRWSVTLSFLFIVLFGCATPDGAAEGWKIKKI